MGRIIPFIALAALAGSLAGCTGEGDWSKDGVSKARIAADYAACRSSAQRDIRRDVEIDSDIAAGRQVDWAKSQSTEIHQSDDASANNERSGNVVVACMEAKGYAPNGPNPEANQHLLNLDLF
jgi:hypothetical protein